MFLKKIEFFYTGKRTVPSSSLFHLCVYYNIYCYNVTLFFSFFVLIFFNILTKMSRAMFSLKMLRTLDIYFFVRMFYTPQAQKEKN